MSGKIEAYQIHRSGRPRQDFRAWLLENFPYFDGQRKQAQKNRAMANMEIIMDAVRLALEWTRDHSVSEIVEYYEKDLENIQAAFEQEDPDEFLSAIDDLADAIEME